MKAGPSKPQQGYVGTDCAKVQRKKSPDGWNNSRVSNLDSLTPVQERRLADPPPQVRAPSRRSDTSGLSVVLRWGRFFVRCLNEAVWRDAGLRPTDLKPNLMGNRRPVNQYQSCADMRHSSPSLRPQRNQPRAGAVSFGCGASIPSRPRLSKLWPPRPIV
jgi:hypothetical protein